MNKDVFEGKWKQCARRGSGLVGQTHRDDVDKVAGTIRCLRWFAAGEIWLYSRACRRGDRKAVNEMRSGQKRTHKPHQ